MHGRFAWILSCVTEEAAAARDKLVKTRVKPEKRIRVRAIVSETMGVRICDIIRCFLVALDDRDYFFFLSNKDGNR